MKCDMKIIAKRGSELEKLLKQMNERLPEPNKLVLCRMVSNGAIVSGYIVVSSGRSPYVATDGGFEFEDWNGYECDMWMYIPSFDDILEANRDVLERIKEKGD